NRVQAMIPAGAEAIPNANGTAPGVWMKHGDCLLAAMPGVPSEMFVMYEREVKSRLLALGLAGGGVVQREINCFGAGESALQARLLDITRRGPVPEVGITVSDSTISMRILPRPGNTVSA